MKQKYFYENITNGNILYFDDIDTIKDFIICGLLKSKELGAYFLINDKDIKDWFYYFGYVQIDADDLKEMGKTEADCEYINYIDIESIIYNL